MNVPEMYGNYVEAEEHAIEDAKRYLKASMELMFEENGIEQVGEHEFVVKNMPPHMFWNPNLTVGIKVKGVKQP